MIGRLIQEELLGVEACPLMVICLEILDLRGDETWLHACMRRLKVAVCGRIHRLDKAPSKREGRLNLNDDGHDTLHSRPDLLPTTTLCRFLLPPLTSWL